MFRKRNRLESYTYDATGYYFVTVCTRDKEKLFWENNAPCRVPVLSEDGRCVEKYLRKIESVYPCVLVDKYVIMPNHIHMILHLTAEGGANVSTIMQNFKRAVTMALGKSVWQRNFHDHVIRGERDYRKIWTYIDGNPQKWSEDCYFE